MSNNDEMILFIKTDREGSESSWGLNITKNDWEELTKEEQDKIITENLCNIIDIQVRQDD